RKRKIPERQKRGFFSSLESAYTKGALSTFRPPRRLLHSLRIQPRKELSSATLSAPLQAHASIGKDCDSWLLSIFGALAGLRKRPHEPRRARHVSRVNPSSGTALKTEPTIEGTEDFLHFRREHLKRLACAIASHHA